MAFGVGTMFGAAILIACLSITTFSFSQSGVGKDTNYGSLLNSGKQEEGEDQCDFAMICYHPVNRENFYKAVGICDYYMFVKGCCCNVIIMDCGVVCAVPCQGCQIPVADPSTTPCSTSTTTPSITSAVTATPTSHPSTTSCLSCTPEPSLAIQPVTRNPVYTNMNVSKRSPCQQFFGFVRPWHGQCFLSTYSRIVGNFNTLP